LETSLGFTAVTTGATGSGTFRATIAGLVVNYQLTATATDPGGNTSVQPDPITVALQSSQVVSWNQTVGPVTYGVAPITLSASSDAGLPVTYSVVSGPGSVAGDQLTVTGAGTIVVTATQA